MVGELERKEIGGEVRAKDEKNNVENKFFMFF